MVYPRRHVFGMEVIWVEFTFMDSLKTLVSHRYLSLRLKSLASVAGAGKSVLWYVNYHILILYLSYATLQFRNYPGHPLHAQVGTGVTGIFLL